VPHFGKSTVSRFLRTHCQRQLRLSLAAKDSAERARQGMPDPQAPRWALLQAGNEWEQAKICDLEEALGPGSLRGNRVRDGEGRADCRLFQDRYGALIEACSDWLDCNRPGGYSPLELAGHDFWLTREGHGTGFWEDGRWPEAAGDVLDVASTAFGTFGLEVGDDGRIHGMGHAAVVTGLPDPAAAIDGLSVSAAVAP
jgi:hypothetical protein